MNPVEPQKIKQFPQMAVEMSIIDQVGRLAIEVLTKSEIKLLISNHPIAVLFVHDVVLVNRQNLEAELLIVVQFLYIVVEHHFLNKLVVMRVILEFENSQHPFVPRLVQSVDMEAFVETLLKQVAVSVELLAAGLGFIDEGRFVLPFIFVLILQNQGNVNYSMVVEVRKVFQNDLVKFEFETDLFDSIRFFLYVRNVEHDLIQIRLLILIDFYCQIFVLQRLDRLEERTGRGEGRSLNPHQKSGYLNVQWLLFFDNFIGEQNQILLMERQII